MNPFIILLILQFFPTPSDIELSEKAKSASPLQPLYFYDKDLIQPSAVSIINTQCTDCSIYAGGVRIYGNPEKMEGKYIEIKFDAGTATIHKDGKLTYEGEHKPDKAAEEFLESVSKILKALSIK